MLLLNFIYLSVFFFLTTFCYHQSHNFYEFLATYCCPGKQDLILLLFFYVQFQELSAIVPAREKQTIVRTAISKVQKSSGDIRVLGWLFRNKKQSNLHLTFPDSLLYLSYDIFPSPSNAVPCSNTAAVRLSSSNLQPWNSLGQFLTYLFILKWLVIVGYVHCIHCHILCCCACHWVLNPDSVMFYFAVWFSRGHAKNWRNSES